MAHIVKAVYREHPCGEELKGLPGFTDLWMGSIVECSCGKQYIRRDDQRDDLHWAELEEGERI